MYEIVLRNEVNLVPRPAATAAATAAEAGGFFFLFRPLFSK